MKNLPFTQDATVILSGDALEKIRDLQSYLSLELNRRWSLNDTLLLLCRYAIGDYAKIDAKSLKTMKTYFDRRQNLLDKICSQIIQSCHDIQTTFQE